MKKNVLSCVLALVLLVSLIPMASAVETKTFWDVPTSHWAFQYINDMVQRGVISGYPEGAFHPNSTVSRAEFAKILIGAAGLESTPVDYSSFADVPQTHWGLKFIETAIPYMNSYEDDDGFPLFRPDEPAKREDIAVAIVKLKGYDVETADLNLLKASFNDVAALSDDARPYVALAVENKIINGYPDRTFRGQGTITRAETVSMLCKAFPVEKEGYIMDTVVRKLNDYRSMVLTDTDALYYLDGNILRATNSTSFLDLRTDLVYPLNTDDKNVNYALNPSGAHLAYSNVGEKVYLFANSTVGQGNMKIFDVTDLANPIALMAPDLEGMTYSDFYHVYDDYGMFFSCPTLSNGAIWVPGYEGSYIVYPEQAAVDSTSVRLRGGSSGEYTAVVGDTVLFLKEGGNTMELASLRALDSRQTVSVENSVPAMQYSHANQDGLYYWKNEDGLFLIDLKGKCHKMISANAIDCVDFLGLPNNIWDMYVNGNGTWVFYDNTTESIRLLKKQ